MPRCRHPSLILQLLYVCLPGGRHYELVAGTAAAIGVAAAGAVSAGAAAAIAAVIAAVVAGIAAAAVAAANGAAAAGIAAGVCHEIRIPDAIDTARVTGIAGHK